MIPPNAHVGRMQAYALADLSAPEGRKLISLCQNESLRPPSPLAIEASAAAARSQQFYPDPEWHDLRKAVAGVHGIEPSDILCGNGSLDLIGCLARAYLGPGTAALAPAHAYPFFRTAALACGAGFETAPEHDLTVDVDALLAALSPGTRIIFVANPGNPTGTRIPKSELRRLRAGLGDDVMLVIDEAYGEFADHLDEGCFDMVAGGNTVILRTMSKAYGLAGARVGWGLFPPRIASEVRKLLNPNNTSAVSQAAAAAAMHDQDYMQQTCALTAEIRDRFNAGIASLGLRAVESFTNFTLIQFPSADAAQEADRYLRRQGIFLRPQGGTGLPDCLRATLGVADDMAQAAQCLKDWAATGGMT